MRKTISLLVAPALFVALWAGQRLAAQGGAPYPRMELRAALDVGDSPALFGAGARYWISRRLWAGGDFLLRPKVHEDGAYRTKSLYVRRGGEVGYAFRAARRPWMPWGIFGVRGSLRTLVSKTQLGTGVAETYRGVDRELAGLLGIQFRPSPRLTVEPRAAVGMVWRKREGIAGSTANDRFVSARLELRIGWVLAMREWEGFLPRRPVVISADSLFAAQPKRRAALATAYLTGGTWSGPMLGLGVPLGITEMELRGGAMSGPESGGLQWAAAAAFRVYPTHERRPYAHAWGWLPNPPLPRGNLLRADVQGRRGLGLCGLGGGRFRGVQAVKGWLAAGQGILGVLYAIQYNASISPYIARIRPE